MSEILKNLANLIKVKTIVTLAVIGIFAVLAIMGDINADNVMIIVSMVTAFYFGTQHEKKAAQAADAAAQPAQACDTAACPYLETAADTNEVDPLEGAGV